MVKEPRAGCVKTRLGRDIGMTAAAWWFRHQTRRLIRHLSNDPRWQTVLAVSPDTQGLQSPIWPAHLPRWAQGSGDLGDRMGAIFADAPKGPVIIIGADIPGITPTLINDAFRQLGNNDVVLGPAPDGGYWLIGMKRGGRAKPRTPFANIRWSTDQTMADTLVNMDGFKVGYVDQLQDVDTVADLAKINF